MNNPSFALVLALTIPFAVWIYILTVFKRRKLEFYLPSHC